LQGQLSWAGSPLTLDYPSLEGKLRLDVDAGQFLHADPGSARLLGVLSLQSLPRRLSLDFRDLFQEGFAFDSIEGDVAIARGVAETTDMHMSGAQATVLMQGSADLRRETQDLRVLVVPKIDATGAALATMAINPALGLGTLFAQWALREPLIAAGTSELHITGSWADPQVQRIDRNHGAPDPARGAAEPPKRGPPDEDRRTADGVHARRGPQPRCRRALIAQAAAAGAQLVALPEYFCLMGRRDDDKLAIAEAPGEGPIQRFLSAQARQHGLWIVGGTLPLRTASAARVRNSCLVFAPDGSAGRALRQDAPVRLRQRPRAATTKGACSRPAPSRWPCRRGRCASA
jgi:hypothetical protein